MYRWPARRLSRSPRPSDSVCRRSRSAKATSASVEISSYRPLVTRLVANPGKYNFSPGLTVVQALSMAGGIGSTDTQHNWSATGRIVQPRPGAGTPRWKQSGSGSLRGRRVDAVLSGASSVSFPQELISEASLQVCQMMDEERSLFATREQSMRTEIKRSRRRAKVLATRS